MKTETEMGTGTGTAKKGKRKRNPKWNMKLIPDQTENENQFNILTEKATKSNIN